MARGLLRNRLSMGFLLGNGMDVYPEGSRSGGKRYTMRANRDPIEAELVARLQTGDESAFISLVDTYHATMIRFARGFVRNRATAEEVVQDAWVGVLQGLASFEGRSSLKSWIFTIVANRAKTRGIREARSTPFSALADLEASGMEPAVDPLRFRPPGAEWPGHWAAPPESWGGDPEARLLQAETMAQIGRALESLPRAQRAVVTLRDVAGHSSESVCNILGITETNMRVLLHRGRSKIRGELERYFSDLASSARSVP
jgi:RNA polymerase sigma-70 factor, ECF subfamily